MSNFDFMKSGHQITQDGDTKFIEAVQAMVLVFLEDATKMAINYAQAKDCDEITDEIIINCLKARAQFGIILDEKYTERMKKILSATKDCSEEQRLQRHFSSMYNEAAFSGGEDDEQSVAARNIIVSTVDKLALSFDKWEPQDRFQKIIKDAIISSCLSAANKSL